MYCNSFIFFSIHSCVKEQLPKYNPFIANISGLIQYDMSIKYKQNFPGKLPYNKNSNVTGHACNKYISYISSLAKHGMKRHTRLHDYISIKAKS